MVEWKLVRKYPDWEEYFDYYEAKAEDGGTLFARKPKKGYEFLDNEHGSLDRIKALVSLKENNML